MNTINRPKTHYDIKRPKRQYGSCSHAQIQKQKPTCPPMCGPLNSESLLFDLSESSHKSPELLLDGPATSVHMSALLPFKFPALLDLFVTTTSTMHVRRSHKSIASRHYNYMHKAYYPPKKKYPPKNLGGGVATK